MSQDITEDMNLQKDSVTDSLQGFNPIKSGAEMDYSLLASDMQKFLHISSKSTELDEEPPRKLFKSSLLGHSSMDASKGKLRTFAELEDIAVNKCPFCPASFNSKNLLARHTLRIHHKAVVNLLQDGSTQQHLKCRFCVHKVMHRHQKLLLLHLEKKHSVEFVSFLRQICVPSSEACNLGDIQVLNEQAVDLVHEGFQNISLSSCIKDSDINTNSGMIVMAPRKEDEKLPKNSNKSENFMGSVAELKTGHTYPFIQVAITDHMTNHSYAKRKLILDGTSDCALSKTFLMKENVPPKESLSTTLASSGWQHASGKHFTCGRCKEAFSCNALLLDHVSARHRGPLRLLQPIFTCGLCSAAFYKNSFLVRHCYQHHTPKCT